jgi:signal transduction histidine kinase
VRSRVGWILALAAVGILYVRPAAAQAPAPPGLPLITTIEGIRALSQDEGARGYPVRIRGTITHVDEQADTSVMLHDGRFGQFVSPPPVGAIPAWRELTRGDFVEIEGRTVRGGFAPNVQPETVRRLGRGELPRPKQVALASLLTGRHDCDYVELTGVVQRAWVSSDPQMHTLFADVAVADGVVRAFFWDYTPADIERFIDARVRLRGNAGTLFGRTEQLRGVSLFVGRTADVEVLEPPPNPFWMQPRSIRSIYNYSSAGEVNRRIRVRGVVTAYVPGRPVEVGDFTTTGTFRYVRHVFYVDDGTGGARIETEQPQRLRPGTVVEVAGFPAVTHAKPILTNAIFKVAGTAAQPPAQTLAAKDVLSPENDAALVRMEGHFLSMLTSPTQRTLVLKVGDTAFDAILDVDTATPALQRLRPGSLVSITGVYAYQWGPPPVFRLFLRSSDDVTVLVAASWWTLSHSAVMGAIVALVACGFLFWVRATTNRKRQQYQAVLSERSRVGRELHDTLEQGLAGISLQLEAVAGSLDGSPHAARQSLDVARQMLRYSQEEARRSVMDLRSQALETRDLAGALADLARQMTLGTGVRADVQVEGVPQRLDASDEHHLLRIGVEAVTNALKHSRGRNILITLAFRGGETQLVVQDDGCGLGQGAPPLPGGHFGLLGIRERVDKLGGTLDLSGEADAGTRLSVTIPARRPDRGAAPLLGESWRTS